MGYHLSILQTVIPRYLRLFVALTALLLAENHIIGRSLAEGIEDVGVAAQSDIYRPTVVYFQSALPPPPSAFRRRQAEEKGLPLNTREPLTVLGRLFVPEGNPPFPAVVLLHGSHGIWDWSDIWAERLREWGYAVLDVDSMTPRGLYRYNTGGYGVTRSGRAKKLIDPFSRSLDAHGARNYLSALPIIDSDRIAALGMSQGGTTAMLAVTQNKHPSSSGVFQAAVALYPHCERYVAFASPLLVLIGSADEWVSSSRCEANLATIPETNELTLKVYDDVHHVFDIEALDQRFLGLLSRYDPEAAADAISRIKVFLAKHLG